MKNKKLSIIKYIGDALFIITTILFSEEVIDLKFSLILFDVSLICIWPECFYFLSSKEHNNTDAYFYWLIKIIGLTVAFITANILAIIMINKKML